jgi:CelD/BcsL family acetyltransferase involved in cellulose biosynthesis
MVEVEVIHGRAVLGQLQADWARLMEEGDHEPSVSLEWTAALMESHVQPSDEVVSIILRRQGVVVGIIPLVFRSVKTLGQRFVTACPISELSNTHSDLLLQEASGPMLRAFMEGLYRLTPSWDAFVMTRILEAGHLYAPLHEYARKYRKHFECVRTPPSFVLTLEDTMSGYLRRRSGNFRNALKRIERKLEQRGHMDIKTQEEFPSIEEAYAVLLSIERHSWKHAHGTSIPSVPRQTSFYRRLCQLAHQKNWLRLEFLYLDGRPVAYNLGLVLKDTYFYLKTSYDEAERPLSPATFLRARLVEDLIRQGITRLDFPAEPYEWERQWTNELRWHRSLALFAPTAKGMVYGFYRKVRAFRRRDDSMEVHFRNPRDLTPGHS